MKGVYGVRQALIRLARFDLGFWRHYHLHVVHVAPIGTLETNLFKSRPQQYRRCNQLLVSSVRLTPIIASLQGLRKLNDNRRTIVFAVVTCGHACAQR